MVDLEGLPAGERVRRGLRDLSVGKRSVEALLLLSATRRLRSLGIEVPASDGTEESELYELLRRRYRDAYGRYNSLRRELSSFLECLETRSRRPPASSHERGRRVGPTEGRP